MNDPIAEMITRIYNATRAGKQSLVLPFSNFKLAVAELLVKEGFLKSAVKHGKKLAKSIEIELAYEDGEPKIKGVDRISKLSRREYMKAGDLHAVRQGYGRLILSTPKGILTGKEAKTQNVGGEALFKIW